MIEHECSFSRASTPSAGGWVLAGIVVALALLCTGINATDSPAGVAPRVHRTWMPGAYPSSYAIGFSTGLNFCFDPIRANLIYAWQGDYIDLSPTVNGKIPRDAIIRGTMFYESLTRSGFTSGSDSAPQVRFRAFRLRRNVPEFEYDIDDVRVSETIRASADGSALIRQFRLTTGDRKMSFRAADQSKVLVESGDAHWRADALELPANSTIVFSLAVPRP